MDHNQGMKVAVDALSGRTAPRKLSVGEIHLRKGHKGGYIAKHQMQDEDGIPHHKTPEFPIANRAALHKHIDEHFPADGAGDGKESDGGGTSGGAGC